jgi:hypothetical protein
MFDRALKIQAFFAYSAYVSSADSYQIDINHLQHTPPQGDST